MYRFEINYDRRDFVCFTKLSLKLGFGVLLLLVDILMAIPVLSVPFAVSQAVREGRDSSGLVIGILLTLLYLFWLFGLSEVLGRRAYRQYQEAFGKTVLIFRETSVICETGKTHEEYRYEAFKHFICDKNSCYLLLNKTQGYILPRRFIGAQQEAFAAFVEEKTGKKCKRA